MIIEKKCWPMYFEAVRRGDKPFELRLNDFDCNVGDTLRLREFNPAIGYTGRALDMKITYVLNTKELNIWLQKEIDEHGFKILGLRKKGEVEE